MEGCFQSTSDGGYWLLEEQLSGKCWRLQNDRRAVRGRLCVSGKGMTGTLKVGGVWCLVSECLEPIPPDAPDTAAPARLGWTSPHRGGRSVHRVALVSPSVPPPPSLGSPPPSAGRHTARAGGGEFAVYRLPMHCTVLERWRAWVAELQARHALRCIRAFSGRVE